jgi:hypothetical protein
MCGIWVSWLPQHDRSWLKPGTKRIKASAIPRNDRTRGIIGAEFYAIGIDLMATAEEASSTGEDGTVPTPFYCSRKARLI